MCKRVGQEGASVVLEGRGPDPPTETCFSRSDPPPPLASVMLGGGWGGPSQGFSLFKASFSSKVLDSVTVTDVISIKLN